MLEIDQDLSDKIAAHGERDYPYECCGLLLGRFVDGGVKAVSELYPISNAREDAAKRNRFLITPLELMRGGKYARENDLEVVGFYHSHPDHPANPSQYDLDHALPVYSYVIVSIMQGKASSILCWEMAEDRTCFQEEQIMDVLKVC